MVPIFCNFSGKLIMIEFEEIFDVYSVEGFDEVFYSSLPHLDAGNYHFENQALETPEEKLNFLKEKFHLFARVENGRVFIVKKDGKLVRAVAGVLDDEDPGYVVWAYDLIGPDAAGSKSWVYGNKDPEFIRDHFKLKGYKMPVVYGGSEYNYHLNNTVPENMVRDISEPHQDPNNQDRYYSIITITFV